VALARQSASWPECSTELLSDGWQRRLQTEEVREVRLAALRRRYRQ